MNKGYEEKLSFKTRLKRKFKVLKYKKISITFLISLASLYLAMIITFSIVYTSYKQTHPYTAQEISELTSIVYVLPYVEETSTTQSYAEQETTTDSTQVSDIETEVINQEETTNQDIEETTLIDTTQISQDVSTATQAATTNSTTTATAEPTTTNSATTATTQAATQATTSNSTRTTTQATTTNSTTTQAATTTTTTTTTVSSSILSTSLNINALVYTTASGTKFHFNSCSYLSDEKIELTYGEALQQNYTPCSRCFPDG